MRISDEMLGKIRLYAKEQSSNYLQDAEMTYLEKLRAKSGRTRQKIGRKLSRFKGTSDKRLDATNDLTLYMSDYMEDLMARGLDEQQAYEKACAVLRYDSDTEEAKDLNDRFRQYIESRKPALQEAIGAFYGGFLLLGLASGGLAGYLLGGGRAAFYGGGWIDTLLGALVGAIAGIALGLIANGFVALSARR